jgi:hypothetical protein
MVVVDLKLTERAAYGHDGSTKLCIAQLIYGNCAQSVCVERLPFDHPMFRRLLRRP